MIKANTTVAPAPARAAQRMPSAGEGGLNNSGDTSVHTFPRKLVLPGSAVADPHVALWLQASALFL
jgi:hypothetical protein